MKICLVGCGKAGLLHLKRWNLLGCEVVTIVDIAPSEECRKASPVYFQISDIPSHIANKIDIWDICTPTSSHISCILSILELNKKANILVEKPLCDIDQINLFEQYIKENKKGPNFKIIVNDPYNFSHAVKKNVDFIKKIYSQDDIKSIYIEFSKNRISDEKNGRFIDTKSGALGYEWFHMLSILNLFLKKREMKEYLDSSFYSDSNSNSISFTMNSAGLPDNIEEKITLSSHKEVTLYTSMGGAIRYPLDYFYQMAELPSYLEIQEKEIAFGVNRKYRAVHLILKEISISILFGYSEHNLNHHLVIYKDKNGAESYHITQDHMLDSIKHSLHYFQQNSSRGRKSIKKAIDFENKILKMTRFINTSVVKEGSFKNETTF